MKNKILKTLLIITLLASIPIISLAYGGVDTDVAVGNSDAATSSISATEKILGALQLGGSIISVVALMIIGIRYMTSSIEARAQMKGVIGYYIIGCILVFATSNILGVAYSLIEGLNSNHSWKISRLQATCTTNGYIKRECVKCGKRVEETISATGHSYIQKSIKEATCTVDGRIEQICAKCSDIKTQILLATGHNYGEWTTKIPAKCTMDGSEKRKCLRCDSVETQSIAALGHSYGSYTTTKLATCTSLGSKKRTCSTCGKEETATIEKLQHIYITGTYKCKICGKEVPQQVLK